MYPNGPIWEDAGNPRLSEASGTITAKIRDDHFHWFQQVPLEESLLGSCSFSELTAVTLDQGFSHWVKRLSGTSEVRGEGGESSCFHNHRKLFWSSKTISLYSLIKG